MLDNECLAGLKKVMRNSGVTFQLVPPHLHRTNAAGHAIATYKDHIISGISSCDPSLPFHLWDRLISQATPTLNLLRPSRINPCISIKSHLNGDFGFNCRALAPPSTKVLVFEAPGVCHTWSPHGVTSRYVSSTHEHYRLYRVYTPKTRAERIVKTVEFFPHSCHVLKSSSANAAVSAAGALTNALVNPMPTPSPKSVMPRSRLSIN